MSRISKKEERYARCPKKRHYNLAKKTGSKKDNLENGYKVQLNSIDCNNCFISKVK